MFKGYTNGYGESSIKTEEKEEGELDEEAEKERDRVDYNQYMRNRKNIEQEKIEIERAKKSFEHHIIGAGEEDDDSDDEEMEGHSVRLPSALTQGYGILKKHNIGIPRITKRLQEQHTHRSSSNNKQYCSFPTSRPSGSSIREYCEVSDSDEEKPTREGHEKKKSKKQKKSKDRSSSRSSDRYRRRRRNSSSSSSRSGSNRNRYSSKRRRSKSPEKRPRVTVFKTEKWSFLTDNEYRTMETTSDFFIIHRMFDAENFTLGFPSREKSKYRRKLKYVVNYGTEMFQELYKNELELELPKKKKTKKFTELLKSIASHVPQETAFMKRPRKFDNNYVVISTEKYHEYDDKHVEVEKEKDRANFGQYMAEQQVHFMDETIKNAISDLQTKSKFINIELCQKPRNVELWIRFLKLQDEIYEAKRECEINDPRNAHWERKEEILNKAIKLNLQDVSLQLMRIELFMEMEKPSDAILDFFQTLVHSFPHEPLAWTRYLDYVQFNNHVYNYGRMEKLYGQCMEKVKGLVEGTLKSHLSYIKDMKKFRKFQLYIYVRYNKWLIGCGFIPKAIANIQATFEANFGISTTTDPVQKMNYLRTFWSTNMPRIGDEDGRGASRQMERVLDGLPSSMIEKLELVDYDKDLHNVTEAMKNLLERPKTGIAQNWVDFERKMMDIDARVKRNDKNKYMSGYPQEINSIEMWNSIRFEELRVYLFPNDEKERFFVQPLLELLGCVFITSTDQYSLAEDVIDRWVMNSALSSINPEFFEKVPTYAENSFYTISSNILEFLIKFEYAKGNMNEAMNLLAAHVLTTAKKFERERGQEMWKLTTDQLKKLFEQATERYKEFLQENKVLENFVSLIIYQKFIEWHQSARRQYFEISVEIEKCARSKNETLLYLDDEDKKRILSKIPKNVHSRLQKTSPLWKIEEPSRLRNNLPLKDLQIQLFGILLRTNMIPIKEKQAMILLISTQLLEITKEEVNFEETEKVFKRIEQLRDHVINVENEEARRIISKTDIDALPAASYLCECLKIMLTFVTLKVGHNDHNEVEELSREIIKIGSKTNPNNMRMIRDVKMIFDQIFEIMDDNDLKMLYFKSYKDLVAAAQALFPSDVRYVKRYVDENTTSIIRTIGLQKSLNKYRNRMRELQKQRFDQSSETIGIVQALASIYSSMKAEKRIDAQIEFHNNHRDSSRKLLKILQNEAEMANEPALWRVALRYAAQFEDGHKGLDETHIRANGKCPWSRNIHIDRVAGEATEQKFIDILMLILENSHGTPHKVFIDDRDVLKTFEESSIKTANDVE